MHADRSEIGEVLWGLDPGFGDQPRSVDAMMIRISPDYKVGKLGGMGEIGLHLGEITIIDPQQHPPMSRGIDEGEDPLKVGSAMGFEQDAEIEPMSQIEHLDHLRIVEAFGDQQDGIGAVGAGFEDLVRIEDEILTDDRKIDALFDSTHEGEVPAEEFFVREAGNSRCACLGVLLRDEFRHKSILFIFWANQPGRGALPLDLGDNARAWIARLDQCAEKVPRWFRISDHGFEILNGEFGFGFGDLAKFEVDDLAEHGWEIR